MDSRYSYINMSIFPTIIAVIAAILIVSVKAGHLELFDGKNFDGYFYESIPSFDCITIPPSEGQGKASSLKTDVCIIVSDHENCTNEANTIKIPPGEHPDLAKFSHATVNFDNRIAAFTLCEDSDHPGLGGGDRFHVDLAGPGFKVHNRDICECVNLPEFAFGKVTALNNWGNCVRLFSREECQGDSVDIQGGWSAESMNLDVVKFKGLTKSYSVCGDSTLCSEFHSEIFQLELITNPAHSRVAQDHNEELGDTVTYRNRGKNSITEDYAAKSIVKEIVHE